VEELRRRAVRTAAEADLICKDIRSAGGKGTESDRRARHTVYNFIDGAVAARRKYKIAPFPDGTLGEFTGAIWSRSGVQFDFATDFLKDFNSQIQTKALRSFEAAGERIIDDTDSMKWVRDNFNASRTKQL
jgi:hypothetical protein